MRTKTSLSGSLKDGKVKEGNSKALAVRYEQIIEESLITRRKIRSAVVE